MRNLYEYILNREALWIASLQLANGAVPTYSAALTGYQGQYKVVPYFSHLGLLGLLEMPEYAPIVLRYIQWYFEHLNRQPTPEVPEGTVFDYAVDPEIKSEKATGDFDSTDSYASTFLNLLRKYVEVTGNVSVLTEHKDDILLIGGAMVATMREDGLTWAKPAYRVKYLMDNSEVFLGLLDLEWIAASVFQDEALAADFRRLREEVKAGIFNELWSESLQAFAYAKNEVGTLSFPDWTRFYPDATAQLFPIWTGLLSPDSEEAVGLYRTFNRHHPDWHHLRKDDAFPWALLAFTAAMMGDESKARRFLESAIDTYIGKDHPWPWYVMESGFSMLTAALLKNGSK